jgi:hypothetical protein
MIKELLEGKTQPEKEDIKIKKFCKSKLKKFKIDDFDIDIIDVSQEDDLLKVVVSAQKNKNDIIIDNPLYFKNPPILVRDKNEKLIEDTDQALKDIIFEAIKVTYK